MIYIGADHRGYEQKKGVARWLSDAGIEYVDVGAKSMDPEDDWNDYASEVARKVVQEKGSRGILICGSGQGVCMQANRFRGVRAVMGLTPELTEMGRKHEDANVLCLAADFVPEPNSILRAFFETDFLGDEKYVRRNRKLDEEA